MNKPLYQKPLLKNDPWGLYRIITVIQYKTFLQNRFKVHSMYLGPKIFGVHYALFSAFDLETNRKKPDVCYFLIIWFVKLDYVAKALHHTYSCAPEVTFNLLQYFTIYV